MATAIRKKTLPNSATGVRDPSEVKVTQILHHMEIDKLNVGFKCITMF